MNDSNSFGWVEVGNSVLLKKIYGYWPAFHDARILSIKIEREEGNSCASNVLIELRHWGQDDPNWIAPGPDCVITLIFRDVKIADVSMDAIVDSNEVYDLCFARTDDNLLLFELDPACGASIFIACAAAGIVEVKPYCVRASSNGEK